MLLSLAAIVVGLAVLVWSADRFVEGAAATAKHLGMPSLLIGMVVVGFGTSAPEMTVSAFAAWEGNPALALGNAYGSNTLNIALILGITAVIAVIAVHSDIVRKEMPILLAVTLLSGLLLWDKEISRGDAVILLVVFCGIMGWSIYTAMRGRQDALSAEVEEELTSHPMTLKTALAWLAIGLLLLIISSRVLVWGAVEVAHALGVSDLIIGLTIVALGTSLPELASSIAAARKGESDLALGNIVGSNLFNTLAVVGIAGAIAPIAVADEVLTRDFPVMLAVTAGLFIMAYGFKKPGHLTHWEGILLLSVYMGYTGWLFFEVVG
ncbi:MAG TPA: calcium/sodium antiporter [Candidatus Thiothrix moscowensis]|uniref:calcium/sodium antiporter n=1 Tax=unclassified Thiothrix TaxID=2636184 RepID=UPI0025FA22A0|nr:MULTISPECIES: calcium/sodium antiporter [unclassified Thiothrix]HRJ53163.1 calcium/sodium antiporter [Candidatus Thiothrix moscowensis]HRJ93267.1 calcium/sodium antiporter [Candidatus Thiothrix moscowensis]